MEQYQREKLEDFAEEEIAAGTGYIQTALDEIDKLQTQAIGHRTNVEKLRDALAGMLGTKNIRELESMAPQFEHAQPGTPPHKIKGAMLNAINALIATSEITYWPPMLLPMEQFEITKGKTQWIISKK